MLPELVMSRSLIPLNSPNPAFFVGYVRSIEPPVRESCVDIEHDLQTVAHGGIIVFEVVRCMPSRVETMLSKRAKGPKAPRMPEAKR